MTCHIRDNRTRMVLLKECYFSLALRHRKDPLTFLCVPSDMLLQCRSFGEILLAYHALKRTVARMRLR